MGGGGTKSNQLTVERTRIRLSEWQHIDDRPFLIYSREIYGSLIMQFDIIRQQKGDRNRGFYGSLSI